ncbi:peptide-methionine (S)-S-oxide reductase [Candidatus Daviesbacteria bacterium RIFCSPHIGHO2_01_FULL_44_29]|uniref:Peptide methionine sulfoxide reductase MsrA n=1 Tax=Candidatus Daviesbacteria bacterium RIFCSPHIGHO2_02_FULL_43_12 TaxID=1797776 RepID=A0A1F5KGJ3_9BACT|nr:MAG: peptide-methionine (S)-S-oxide reductase [Candidatus Daviesbacteria bacterium RIFCSPHIGHO2_01_FULL_44_29]OGE40056.1 MAG: peptide-methionine (S)-S-oxide reductase [Candidatus Daviesbacteria bacterium RIFCSPHIGHO2_02_FULL_43_12]OGE41462.1 MAG: peptide-methionine (S)-S-oxide reductase [Candidatus Daviesbacteria bacterium RIFCSPHIGHO2_12_FULL_47_45]OGE70264.1 MAG: peptide-methionine (S)-S-oxide reductase [Candidatus Daviesbacteria bacterium RIFCSPLOWO2_01_FULL_43_15]
MENKDIATFAGGCFWCTEAIFKRLKGVEAVTPGYTGGTIESPTYWDVASRQSGHAEAIQLTFNPRVISYEQLLDVFWHMHNPTTLNQQGVDRGTEYRSEIFYHSDEQQRLAEKSKQDIEDSGMYKEGVVTKISPAVTFYPAEEDHKDFYEKNRYSPYCMIVIDPKIQKLYKDYKPLLKKS